MTFALAVCRLLTMSPIASLYPTWGDMDRMGKLQTGKILAGSFRLNGSKPNWQPVMSGVILNLVLFIILINSLIRGQNISLLLQCEPSD